MKRLIYIIPFLTITFLGLCSLYTEAQTPPPLNGDWEVRDSTTFSDTQIKINGSIHILDAGHLHLRNVTLIINEPRVGLEWPTIFVNRTSELTMEGGSVSTSIDPCKIELFGSSNINGTTFNDIFQVDIKNWGVSVSNCTFIRPFGSGIVVMPSALNPTYINVINNEIVGPNGYGVFVYITGTVGEVVLNLANNTVTNAFGFGFYINIRMESCRINMERNQVYRSTDFGIYASLLVYNLDFNFDSCVVENAGKDGIALDVDPVNVMRNTIKGLNSKFNYGFGVSVASISPTSWMRPVFQAWNVSSNTLGGVSFMNVFCATIEDSYIVNLGSQYGDYYAIQSSVDIFRTVHGKANARVEGPQSSVTSQRNLDFIFQWQNGLPCAMRTIEFHDEYETVFFRGTTDVDGWMSSHALWDWKLTSSGEKVRTDLRIYLITSHTLMTAQVLPFDRDYNGTITIEDDVIPIFTIETPVDGQYQNQSTIIVRGSCTDNESFVKMVQVSIDRALDWDDKSWIDYPVSGSNATEVLEIPIGPLEDDIYWVFIRAYDTAQLKTETYEGRFANLTIMNIVIDTVAPEIQIIEPEIPVAGIILVNNSVVRIRGTTDLDVVSIDAYGVPQVLSVGMQTDGTFDIEIELMEGMNPLTILVIDKAGNRGALDLHLSLDTIPPDLVITHPPEGFMTNVQSLKVEGYTDDEENVIYVEGTLAGSYGLYWSHFIDLIRGENEIVVEALDPHGNRKEVVVGVYFENQPPIIHIVEPANGSFVNSSTFWINGTVASDSIGGTIIIDGEAVPMVDGVYQHQIGPIDDGPVIMSLYVVDLAGNEATVNLEVVIDTVPPWIDDLSLDDGELLNNPRPLLAGTPVDCETLVIAGKPVEIQDSSFTTSLDLEEGLNIVALELVDKAGNINITYLTVRLDTEPPIIHIDNLTENRLVVHEDFLEITGSTEPNATLKLQRLGEIDIQRARPDGRFRYSIDLSFDGSQITIIAIDPAGNEFQLDLVLEIREDVVPKPWYSANIAWFVTITGGIVICLGLAYGIEVSRYSMIVLFLPLYTRLKKKKILDNKIRYSLHGLIIDQPGVHYSAIIKELGLSNGVAGYHLEVLEREGFIRSVRDGMLKCFYSTHVRIPLNRNSTPEELRKEIFNLILEKPDISQKGIIEELGITRKMAGYHINNLIQEGSVEASRDGKFVVYKIKRRNRPSIQRKNGTEGVRY